MTEPKEVKIDYDKIKNEWNALITKPLVEKQRWMLIALGEFVLLLMLIVGLVQVGLKSKVIVYVVEVDHLGRAVAAGPARELETTDERIIRAFLFRFIDLSRTVITDATGLRKNLNELYMMSSSAAKNYLNESYRKNNPFDIARKGSIEVVPTSFLKQSEKTFICEWKEVRRDLQSHIVEELQFKGLFTISRQSPTEESLRRNPNNAFSIVVESLSWSQLF